MEHRRRMQYARYRVPIDVEAINQAVARVSRYSSNYISNITSYSSVPEFKMMEPLGLGIKWNATSYHAM